MAYGRAALGAARSVLRSTPVGGAIDKVGGIIGGVFGGAPADRAASDRLRALGKKALAGDQAAAQAVFDMAARQGSKFSTINAASIRWAEKLRANMVPAMSGISPTVGAGPAGIMASGGGLAGATVTGPRRRRRRRSSSARRSSPRRRRKARGTRRMSALQRRYFGKRRSSSRRRS